jgi:Lrp/AsnC family transcriptional regulator of lysine biosynthesis
LERGVIKRFTVDVNESELTQALTWIAVAPSTPTNAVSNKLKEIRGVETIFETTGGFDILAVIKGPNIAEVNKSVEEIRRVTGVLNTNTNIILRIIR